MKEYIVLKIENNTLYFDFKIISKDERFFVNKNNFNSDTLYYDLKYYKKNISKIIILLKKKEQTITTLKINRLITFKYIIELINQLNIQILTLNFLSTIDMSDYELFLDCKTLRVINCYFMPSSYKEMFNKNKVIVNQSITKNITDRFMQMQKINNKDKLYYSKVVNIKEEYIELLSDLEEFLKINYKLKAINIYVYSKELISKIIDLVRKDESKNVVIYLHQETDKGNFIVNNFSWLKELSNKCRDEFICEFRIVYANSFLSKNLFKQLTFNNLKLILILCLYVSVVSLLIYKSYEYIEKLSIDKLNASLSENKNETTDDFEEDNEFEEDENIDDNDTNIIDNNDSNQEKEEDNKYYFENSLSKLKKINNETIGYLTIPNTEISYPVVQHSDNGYYLIRDFYKNKSSMGWIYLDYRNNVNNLNDNTIIYGHNMINDTMFGSLDKVLDSSWRKKEENMIVTLDTEVKQYKFKIFSAYKVDYTTDYLVNDFDNNKEKEEFINLITKRSLIKTQTKIDINDKILTLSTCSGSSSNNRRLVVHAVLLKK